LFIGSRARRGEDHKIPHDSFTITQGSPFTVYINITDDEKAEDTEIIPGFIIKASIDGTSAAETVSVNAIISIIDNEGKLDSTIV